MSHDAILDAVERWQRIPKVEPLRCAASRRHRPLIAVMARDRVELMCLDCGYRQASIPDEVFTAPAG